MTTTPPDQPHAPSRAVLELQVANHPGVMSHVVGLFSRRLFNVEGILCLPVEGSRHSRIWLMVNEDARLPQLVRQLERLEDVTCVRRHHASHVAFAKLGMLLEAEHRGVHRPPETRTMEPVT